MSNFTRQRIPADMKVRQINMGCIREKEVTECCVCRTAIHRLGWTEDCNSWRPRRHQPSSVAGSCQGDSTCTNPALPDLPGHRMVPAVWRAAYVTSVFEKGEKVQTRKPPACLPHKPSMQDPCVYRRQHHYGLCRETWNAVPRTTRVQEREILWVTATVTGGWCIRNTGERMPGRPDCHGLL